MPNPTLVAVACTPENTPDVRARLRDALAAAGIPGTEPRLLSADGPIKAAEAEFELPAHAARVLCALRCKARSAPTGISA